MRQDVGEVVDVHDDADGRRPGRGAEVPGHDGQVEALLRLVVEAARRVDSARWRHTRGGGEGGGELASRYHAGSSGIQYLGIMPVGIYATSHLAFS